MAAPKAKSGAGSKLLVGDGASPENFTKLAQVLTLKRSGKKIASEKVTNQDSTIDANGIIWEELLPTVGTAGTLDVTMNFNPTDTTQRNLLTLFDGKQHNLKLEGPNDPISSPVVPYFIWAFTGLLLDFPDVDLPIDKAITLSGKLTLVGPDALTYSS